MLSGLTQFVRAKLGIGRKVQTTLIKHANRSWETTSVTVGHQELTFLTFMHRPSLGLLFIGTEPSHKEYGAGSLLLKLGVEQSKIHHVPIYLESTIEAVPFYKKYGFVERKIRTLSYLPLETCTNEVYTEAALTLRK